MKTVDDVLCEKVVEAALRWNRTISSSLAEHSRVIAAEYDLAKATDALMEHRS